MSKFEVLDAWGPDWGVLNAPRRGDLLASLADLPWLKSAGRTFGMRDFAEYGPGIFAGYFDVESQLRFWTYPEGGEHAARDAVTEYERVFSVLIAAQGRWVVHERRFFRSDIDKPLVRSLFREAFSVACQRAGLGRITRITPYRQSLEDEQMLDRLVHEDARVLRVTIRDLRGRSVPNDYRFFNPRYDLDEEVHTFFNDDLRVLDDAELEAAPQADIRDSKIAQGLARAGSVEQYETGSLAGRRRITRRRVPSTFEMDLDVENPDMPVKDVVEAVLDQVFRTYPDRDLGGADPWAGTMFEGTEQVQRADQ